MHTEICSNCTFWLGNWEILAIKWQKVDLGYVTTVVML
jgi:hypothetical protein